MELSLSLMVSSNSGSSYAIFSCGAKISDRLSYFSLFFWAFLASSYCVCALLRAESVILFVV